MPKIHLVAVYTLLLLCLVLASLAFWKSSVPNEPSEIVAENQSFISQLPPSGDSIRLFDIP
ncbi:MAG TPA: hypothetical protein VLA71_15550, partial [Algoriphagus sp.]|nr:hypothetical protein [Algoriphagus sp.]